MLFQTIQHHTESTSLQGYVKPLLDSECGYLELSSLYMERRFNIHSVIEYIFNNYFCWLVRIDDVILSWKSAYVVKGNMRKSYGLC